MNKPDFNIATNCGNLNRTVIRYKKLCYIGCFTGTKEQAIKAISKKYTGIAKDDYISKIEELYNRTTIADEDVTAANNWALRWASRNGYLEVVKYLVEKGADVTADDNYAIRWASGNGYLEVVKYLKQQLKAMKE